MMFHADTSGCLRALSAGVAADGSTCCTALSARLCVCGAAEGAAAVAMLAVAGPQVVDAYGDFGRFGSTSSVRCHVWWPDRRSSLGATAGTNSIAVSPG